MKKVKSRTFVASISFLIALFALSAVFVLPMTLRPASASSTGTETREKVILAAGSQDATELFVIDSGQPGPVVMVVGGMHGDGVAGYRSAQQISDYTIDRGKLLVLPAANKRAIQLGQRQVPGEEDLNRAFPKTAGQTPDNDLAAAIFSVVKEHRVDWIVDFHEEKDFRSQSRDADGQTLIYYPQASSQAVVEKVLTDLNTDISKSSEKFLLLRYPVKGSLVRSASELLGVNGFIFETCKKQALSTRMNYNLKATDLLLAELGMKSNPSQETREKVVLAKGTKYATDLYIIDSGKPGPVVMVIGGIHGNETAGYKAAHQVKDLTIKKGKLLVLPDANKRAVEADRRYVKGEGDLNRDFPRTSSQSGDNKLARAIYQVVKDYKVDWLMDMHEGYDYYKNKSTDSVGQTLIYYPANSTRYTVDDIVADLNKNISSSYRQFTLLRYPVKGSLARSAGQFLDVHSFIFETSQKTTLSTRVKYQLQAVNTLLGKLNM